LDEEKMMYTRNLSWKSIAILGLSIAILVGCGKPAPTPPENTEKTEPVAEKAEPVVEDGEPVRGDWLVASLPTESEHLNPITATDAYAQGLLGFIFESLITRDNDTLEIKGGLAESWKVAEDKLTYTFRLKEGINFSDGTAITVEDVKFSFDKLKDPATIAPNIQNYYQDVESCEIVDARTLRFVCARPYFKHLSVAGGFPVLPKHIYEKGDINTHENNRHPIGSGPFVFEAWDTGQQIVLARNENYWDRKPYLDKVIFKFITNPDASFQELQRHGLDIMEPKSLNEELWMSRAATPQFEAEFNKLMCNSPGYRYIGWNMRRDKFKDKRVRRALTMLLDRETLLRELMLGLGQVTTGTFFVDDPEYNHAIEAWPFDPVAAKKLLDEAGWVDTDGDGIRDKDGVPLEFELMFATGIAFYEQMGTLYQEELGAAGIVLKIRALEFASLLQSVYEHNFDATMMAWGGVIETDPYQLWHSTQAVVRGSNHVGFINPEGDKILEDARLIFDRTERAKGYHRFGEILHEEQPYTFLYIRKNKVAIDKRFRGVKLYPYIDPYNIDPTEIWVPKHLQRYK
jgi:peptide/nickel transport system substrate-binding protein